MIWFIKDANIRPEQIGYIPEMLSERDERSAKEQIHANYQHGGGWRSFEGFTMLPNGDLVYPGDPVMHPIAAATLRDECILLYEHAWLAIIQLDGSWEVARID